MDAVYLTQDEIIEITGRVKPSAQYRWLNANGFTAKLRADGRPLVSRAHFLLVMDGQLPGSKPLDYEPDFGAL